MRIIEISDRIVFDDGSYIYDEHCPDCCEFNYADFEQIDDLARNYNFDSVLQFESVDGGFRFGDSRMMFFVPCYSNQNGYYSSDVDIYYSLRSGVICASLNVDAELDLR